MSIRDEIERVIKENHLERSKCFECSKITYRSILYGARIQSEIAVRNQGYIKG